jgi:ABC-2 type transport system ATP-binding protein
MDTILRVEQITRDFYPPASFSQLLKLDFRKRLPIRALDSLSFAISKGTILGILGPNGAGKTTLLKIISTLICPDQGTVAVNNYRLGIDDAKIKSSLGLILEEERSFYWRLSGRQNLEFFACLYAMDKKSIRKRINDLLKLFKVDYADKRFDSYSTGMKKRFALMRGLIHNPQLLLLDEPSKSLDYASASDLRRFIREILVKKENKTVIFTTHQISEALDFTDLFMILDKGIMCAFGTLLY